MGVCLEKSSETAKESSELAENAHCDTYDTYARYEHLFAYIHSPASLS